VEKMKEQLSSAKYEETLEPLHGDVKAFYSIPVPEFQGLLLEKRARVHYRDSVLSHLPSEHHARCTAR
jgi:hypothetical protein